MICIGAAYGYHCNVRCIDHNVTDRISVAMPFTAFRCDSHDDKRLLYNRIDPPDHSSCIINTNTHRPQNEPPAGVWWETGT